MSKREDRIKEASSLHAKIGQLQRYCELMVELGEVRNNKSKIISTADRNKHVTNAVGLWPSAQDTGFVIRSQILPPATRCHVSEDEQC